MHGVAKVLAGLAALVCLAAIIYVTFYNYEATKKDRQLLDKINLQHQNDIKNMLDMSTDINYNDKKIVEAHSSAVERMEQIQIDMVKFINEQQENLIKELDIENVKGQLSSTELTLLKHIVETNSDLLKTMVDKETGIHSRIDDLQSTYSQTIINSNDALHKMLQRNIDTLTNIINNYKTDNNKSVEVLRVTLHALQTTVERHRVEDAAALAAQKNDLSALINKADQYIKNVETTIAQTASAVASSPATAYSTLLMNSLYLKRDGSGNIGIHTVNPQTSLEIVDTHPRIRLNGGTAGLEMGMDSIYGRVMMDGNYNMHLLTNDNQDIYLQGRNAQLSDISSTAGNGNVIIGSNPGTTYVPPTLATITQPNATGSVSGPRKLMINGNVSIYGSGDLEFGTGAQKAPDNGKIAYQKWSIDALDITGAGNIGGVNNRKVKVWAEGGSEFTGPVKVSSTCQLSAGPDSTNATINSLSSGCSMNAPGLIVTDNNSTGTIINNIKFSKGAWSNYSDNSIEKAEICNDTTSRKALVIGGNRSSTNTAGQRKVEILDNLVVNGTINANGDITTTGKVLASQDVSVSSDRRLKSDIRPIVNALNKVKTLNGCTFTKNGTKERSTGLIAQDVQQVLPEAITIGEGGYLSVGYGNLIGLLVEAIKNLDAKLEAQTSKA
jgi:hypothetical protein